MANESELNIAININEDEKAKFWRQAADKKITVNIKADKQFTDLINGRTATSGGEGDAPNNVGADSATQRELNTRFQRSSIEFQRLSIPLLRTGAGVARGAVSGLSQLGMGGGLVH
jgi:hypothetical protein